MRTRQLLRLGPLLLTTACASEVQVLDDALGGEPSSGTGTGSAEDEDSTGYDLDDGGDEGIEEEETPPCEWTQMEECFGNGCELVEHAWTICNVNLPSVNPKGWWIDTRKTEGTYEVVKISRKGETSVIKQVEEGVFPRVLGYGSGYVEVSFSGLVAPGDVVGSDMVFSFYSPSGVLATVHSVPSGDGCPTVFFPDLGNMLHFTGSVGSDYSEVDDGCEPSGWIFHSTEGGKSIVPHGSNDTEYLAPGRLYGFHLSEEPAFALYLPDGSQAWSIDIEPTRPVVAAQDADRFMATTSNNVLVHGGEGQLIGEPLELGWEPNYTINPAGFVGSTGPIAISPDGVYSAAVKQRDADRVVLVLSDGVIAKTLEGETWGKQAGNLLLDISRSGDVLLVFLPGNGDHAVIQLYDREGELTWSVPYEGEGSPRHVLFQHDASGFFILSDDGKLSSFELRETERQPMFITGIGR